MKKVFIVIMVLIISVTSVFAAGAEEKKEKQRELHILGTVRRYAGEEQAWNEVFADFEKIYGVKISAKWQGKVDDMITNLQAAKMSGEKVDLCTPNGGRTHSSLAPNGVLMDITELMAPYKDRFGANTLSYYTIGDKLWGFPYGDQSSSVLYYNKTMFDELGLTEPQTFDDLLNIGKVIKNKKNIMPMIHQGKTPSYWLMYFGDIYAQTSGNESIKNVRAFLDGSYSFNGPAEEAAFEVFRKMYDAGLYTEESLATDADGMKATFAKQKAAMFFGGTWELAPTRAMVKDFELGVTSLPNFTNNPNVIVQHAGAPDYGMAIPSFADRDNLDIIMQFIEFILRPENANKILSTYQPIRSAINGVPTLNDKYATKIGTEMVPKNQLWIDWVFPLELNNALQNAVASALVGNITPKQAAAEVQNTYTTLVKERDYRYDWWNKWDQKQWDQVSPGKIPNYVIK